MGKPSLGGMQCEVNRLVKLIAVKSQYNRNATLTTWLA